MLLLCGALPISYVMARVLHGALGVRRNYVPSCSGASQFRKALQISLYLRGMISVTLCFMVWEWRVLRAKSMLIY